MHSSKSPVYGFIIFLGICFLTASAEITAPSRVAPVSNPIKQQANWQDELLRKVSKANRLWSNRQGDLQLSISILQLAAAHQVQKDYKLATYFYLFSLKQADIKADYPIIQQEVRRLLPLAPAQTKKRWKNELTNKNPHLLDDVYGFWMIRDSSPSTEVNERLIEHWQRIAYARKHFTKNHNSPYGTDDRGTIFVRLGPPNRKLKKSLNIHSFIGPLGQRFRLEMGDYISGAFEIWDYYNSKRGNSFFIFGDHRGLGDYGLRNSIYDVFVLHGHNFEKLQSNFRQTGGTTLTEQKFVEYAILKNARIYESQFNEAYQRINNQVLTLVNSYTPITTAIRTAMNSGEKAQDEFKTKHEMSLAPPQASITDRNALEFRHRFYRFLDEHRRPKYIFAAVDHPKTSYPDTTNYYTQNNFYIYNAEWELADQSKKTNRLLRKPVIFTLNNIRKDAKLYFSSELLGLTSNNTATLMSGTGQQKLEMPDPLRRTKPFTISDIVLANKQKPEHTYGLPVLPRFKYTFGKNQAFMIYFEAYGVPKGGYSFTYFFKKDRGLLGHKKVDRTEITVLADKVKNRDSQLFTINPKYLKPGNYQLVFRFKPLKNASAHKQLMKKIDLKITK